MADFLPHSWILCCFVFDMNDGTLLLGGPSGVLHGFSMFFKSHLELLLVELEIFCRQLSYRSSPKISGHINKLSKNWQKRPQEELVGSRQTPS